MSSPLNSDGVHWDAVYQRHGSPTGLPAGVSWYRAHLERSLHWIGQLTAGDTSARIIDVGTGESTLADDLLARGCHALTLVDLSATALAHLRSRLETRLGAAACAGVHWLAGDLTHASLPEAGFDIWHDRAVLHFLTEQSDRAAYVRALRAATDVDSTVILGVFGPDGPTTCSGLPVRRYDSTSVAELLGAEFEVLSSSPAMHTTPSGGTQQFLWTVARRADRH